MAKERSINCTNMERPVIDFENDNIGFHISLCLSDLYFCRTKYRLPLQRKITSFPSVGICWWWISAKFVKCARASDLQFKLSRQGDFLLWIHSHSLQEHQTGLAFVQTHKFLMCLNFSFYHSMLKVITRYLSCDIKACRSIFWKW